MAVTDSELSYWLSGCFTASASTTDRITSYESGNGSGISFARAGVLRLVKSATDGTLNVRTNYIDVGTTPFSMRIYSDNNKTELYFELTDSTSTSYTLGGTQYGTWNSWTPITINGEQWYYYEIANIGNDYGNGPLRYMMSLMIVSSYIDGEVANIMLSPYSARTSLSNVDTYAEMQTSQSGVTVSATTVAVTGVTVTPSTASIIAGSTSQLTATIVPVNATIQTVTWATSNPTIATVNAGLVTGVSAGSATITATSTSNTSASGVSTVTVTSANPVITTPANNITINGGLLQITASAAYTWTLDGSTITSGPLQNFNYFIKDDGTYTLRATDGSGNFTERTITVTHTAPTLSSTIPSWFIDGVFVLQQLTVFTGLALPVGTYLIRAEIDNEAGGVAADQHTITITSSSVTAPSIVEVDSIITGYKIGGLELNNVFAGRSGLAAIADTGFKVETSPGVFTDLAQLFAGRSFGKVAQQPAILTKFKVGASDLNALFAKKGTL